MLNFPLSVSVLSGVALFLPIAVSAQDRFQVDLLARSKGCYECHGANRDGIGPSFQAIAKRYAADELSRAALFSIVKDGGKGNWTAMSKGVPMPPYSGRLSDDEIRDLVDWVLSHQQ